MLELLEPEPEPEVEERSRACSRYNVASVYPAPSFCSVAWASAVLWTPHRARGRLAATTHHDDRAEALAAPSDGGAKWSGREPEPDPESEPQS